MEANGDSNRSSNGELMAGVDRARVFSVEGIKVPEDCVVEAGVMVARTTQQCHATTLSLQMSAWNAQQCHIAGSDVANNE